MVRQLAVVAVLFGIMTALPRLAGTATQSPLDPASLAAFGFIVLAAYTLGEMAERIRLPHITGYLVTGMLCGPYVLGLLTGEVVQDLKLFDHLAVALIGLSAGGALRLDTIRRGSRLLGSVIGSQFLAVMLVVGLLVGLMALPLPGIGIPFLQEGGWGRVVAVALVLGTVASAFSPAATIAVVHGARARGPVTDTVIGVSVLNNVVVVALFALTLGMGERLAGVSTGDGDLIRSLLVTLGGSIALGVAMGALLVAYTRFVRAELLLFVVAATFTGTWVAEQVGADPVLTFILAGFTAGNVSRHGEALFRVVDQLSLPVFVVFFFIAGAGLHLDALRALWPVALLLFGGRLLGLHVGTRFGVRLGRGPEGLSRTGWMAFGPQAGIALSLAMVAGRAFPGFGHTLETLAVATIGLNELVGPALLQGALGMAGETRIRRKGGEEPKESQAERPDGATEAAEVERALPEWLPEPGRPKRNVWGSPPAVSDPRLLEAAGGIRAELQALVRDLRSGIVARRREQAIRFLGLLRREFLRAHRHTSLAVSGAAGSDEWRTALRRERAELASRWEQLLLDRAATIDFRAELKTLQDLVREVDESAQGLPEALVVPLETAWSEPREEDPPRLALARFRVRARGRLRRLVGGRSEEQRVVELRAIARYALSGQMPSYLMEVAGLVAMAERHLLARARNVFEAYHRALEHLITHPQADGAQVANLDLVRTEMEEEFALARREVDRMADDTVRVAAAAMARAWREMVDLVEKAGTAELPGSRYRFSRIYDVRQRSLERLEGGLGLSREMTRGIASSLAMELEMIRLAVHLGEAVETAASGLARDLRGRLDVQFERVADALQRSIGELRKLLAPEGAERRGVRAGIQESSAPLAHVLFEALAIAEKLRNALKSESALEPLIRSMNAGIDGLTDRFLVVTEAPVPRGRALPERLQTRDLHFREAVRSYMDAEAGRDLSVVVAGLRVQVDEAYRGMEEVQRVLAFNTDLAGAELDVLPEGPLAQETMALLREMLVGTLGRLSNRINEIRHGIQGLPERAEEGVRNAVLGNLDRLTRILVEGRHGEFRMRMALEAANAGSRELHGVIRNVARGARNVAEAASVALGPSTIQRLRHALGLVQEPDRTDGSTDRISAPTEQAPIPTVYRRLFSDQSLEAGDLLVGRDAEVEEVRRVLAGATPAVARTVAVVGATGVSSTAVVNAIVRGLPDGVKVHRLELTEHLSAEDVKLRILAPVRETRDHVVVVEGFHWLFTIRVGGFEPLRTLLRGIVADRGRNGWLVSTERPTWDYLLRVVSLRDVFSRLLELGPLDVPALRRAILLRHAMSGYRLQFERPGGHLGWWLKEVTSRGRAEEEVYEHHFFERLHAASAGGLSDALRLWLASIGGVGTSTDTITIADLPTPPLEPIRQLPDDVLLTLRQVMRQGRITAEDHAQQFREDAARSETYLARLEGRGLLQRVTTSCYRLSPDLAGAVHQVLQERRLVG